MTAAIRQVKGRRSRWAKDVIQRELSELCKDTARDVLDLALLFASYDDVPCETQSLRAFLFGELQQTLTRVEGAEAAQDMCAKLAALLLDQTGVHRLTEAPKQSFTRLKAAPHGEEMRHTTRPQTSHTKALGVDMDFDLNAQALIASVNLELMSDAEVAHQEPALHPVLVLSEFPEAAEGIQRSLNEKVEVYHHGALDFFESDLLILASRHPVVVLDCRGKFATFSERFVSRADHGLALLVWGREGAVQPLPGRRMVTCLANSSPSELAMLVDIFLPQYRSGR